MKIDRLQSGISLIFLLHVSMNWLFVLWCLEITHLSKPLLQTEGSYSWSKHVTPGTLSIFQDEKSWNGISNIVTRRKSNVKEFREVNGLSWNSMRDSLQIDSEGKGKGLSEERRAIRGNEVELKVEILICLCRYRWQSLRGWRITGDDTIKCERYGDFWCYAYGWGHCGGKV